MHLRVFAKVDAAHNDLVLHYVVNLYSNKVHICAGKRSYLFYAPTTITAFDSNSIYYLSKGKEKEDSFLLNKDQKFEYVVKDLNFENPD